VDLVSLPMELSRNGTVVVRETGAAVLGSPLTAVAWLARKLAGFGVPLKAGDIVLSGSFGGLWSFAPETSHDLPAATEGLTATFS